MAPNPTQPFRFLDLPGELRDKVYTLLLCSFEDALDEHEIYPRFFSNGKGSGHLSKVLHTNDPAILRASSLVYREAYHIMMKTNRFIRISLPVGLHLNRIILLRYVPTVATGQYAAQFTE